MHEEGGGGGQEHPKFEYRGLERGWRDKPFYQGGL